MKIREIENAKIPRLLKVRGITLYPFILYARIPSSSTRFHEYVHVEQIKRDGFLKFYFMYAVYFLRSWTRGYPWDESYMQIPYEVEAYAEQEKFDLVYANKLAVLSEKIRKAND